ncbi:hypothetical protein QBC32DRAFT_390196 [Pseudoneurospora amorphoporcata]|uniref:Uncharacterized protein n=1 Tax=Pseudoneurospora amorphoporcata TaxID=241081 RepID=A0AAN6NWF7_9PEZI|nr:hypothetical protein QBC32DRAFT_390196 [Pseudoneurospora amorphoporcata]
MSPHGHYMIPKSEDRADGPWPTESKRPIHAAPTPPRFVSMPVANMVPNGWVPAPGPYPAYTVPGAQQNMAGHFGMVHQQQQQQHNWGQYAPCIVTPPMTPPNPEAVCNVPERNRVPPQAHSHVAHWPQGQQQQILYVNPNQANPVYLRAQQQSEKAALEQWYSKLSLEDNEKPSVAETAPAAVTAIVGTEVPTQHSPSVNQVSVPAIADTTGIGATGLTATRTSGAPRIILGPDGTAIVPPPDPAHAGCELSVSMAKAMENFSLDHCCNYLIAKDLLRDKIVKQVLENTQEKLMELLQKELDKMSEEDDSDMDFDGEGEEPDWTLEG